jgi:hypothetical protein
MNYYVSSRGILKSCEYYSTNPISSIRRMAFYPELKTIKHIKNPIIYLCNSALTHFNTIVQYIDFPFILVSGDSDDIMPYDLLKPEIFDKFISNPFLLHWFSQNIDASHPKLTAIPIGLDYHTIADGKIEPWWGEKETPVVQEKFIINLEKPPFEERKLNIYCNFKNSIRGRFGEKDRKTSLIQIPQDLLIIENEKITRKGTWKNMTKYAFVLSPHGNGLDCHRTWEALVLGCIPIVKKSSLDVLYEDLPVLIVDNWSDINKEMLQNTILKYSTAEFNYDKLTLKYWINLITTYRDEI